MKKIKLEGIKKSELLKLAMACCDIYEGSSGITRYKAFPDIKYYTVNGVKLGICTKGNEMVIIFRGTNGTNEWISNFKFSMTIFPFVYRGKNIKVETGFLEGWQNCRRYVLDEIKTFAKENKNGIKLYVAGHSRGAAVAQLCSYESFFLFSHVIKKQICVAVASPRVGNRAFRDAFNKAVPLSYRLKHENDVVTMVPWDKLMRYVHACRYGLWLGKPSVLQRIIHPLRNMFGNPCDHWPQYYVKAIKEEVE